MVEIQRYESIRSAPPVTLPAPTIEMLKDKGTFYVDHPVVWDYFAFSRSRVEGDVPWYRVDTLKYLLTSTNPHSSSFPEVTRYVKAWRDSALNADVAPQCRSFKGVEKGMYATEGFVEKFLGFVIDADGKNYRYPFTLEDSVEVVRARFLTHNQHDLIQLGVITLDMIKRANKGISE